MMQIEERRKQKELAKKAKSIVVEKIVNMVRGYVYPEKIGKFRKQIEEDYDFYHETEGLTDEKIELRIRNMLIPILMLDKEHYINGFGRYYNSQEMENNERAISESLRRASEKCSTLSKDDLSMSMVYIFEFAKLGPDFEQSVYDWDEIESQMGKDAVEDYKQDIQKRYIDNRKLQMINMRKDNIPYYQIAKAALLKWKQGLTEEQADRIVKTLSFEELEEQVGAQDSIDAGLYGVYQYFEEKGITIPDNIKSDINTEVYSLQGLEEDRIDHVIDISRVGRNIGLITLGREYAVKIEDKNELAIAALSEIHDHWVRNNSSKFFARDKKYQHMPLELIGWEEAKSDLLFISPMLEYLGISKDDKDLEEAYNARVRKFFKEKGILSRKHLQVAISSGAEFYPVLKYQTDILQSLANPEFVANTMIPSIENGGIGDIDKIFEKIQQESITQNVDVESEVSNEEQQIKFIPEDIEKATAEVKLPEFVQASQTINENSRDEQENLNDNISKDDE